MFEHVLQVDDYYDGIRTGVALYRGLPHSFRTVGWVMGEGDPNEDRFELRPMGRDAADPILARAEFRRSFTAPDPRCPPIVPHEVQWTPIETSSLPANEH